MSRMICYVANDNFVLLVAANAKHSAVNKSSELWVKECIQNRNGGVLDVMKIRKITF